MTGGARDRRRRTPRLAAAAALTAALAPSPAPAADCADWSARTFLENATAGETAARLDAGAGPNARAGTGATALHLAATWSGDPAVVRLLLDAGADPNARDRDGWTPLHAAAAWNGDPAVVAALLDAGANLAARAGEGRTSLRWSWRAWDNPAVARTLREAGEAPEFEWTPLHLAAAFNDSPSVVAALLDAGADPEARDGSGLTPFDLALGNRALVAHRVLRRLRDCPR